MTALSWRAPPLVALLAVLLLSGCAKKGGPNDPAPAGGGRDGPGGGPPSEVRRIMERLGRGPQALTTTLGKELEADEPAWDVVRPQAEEYARLAADLGKHDPPRGSQESWQKRTADYAEAAAALDRAAKAGDRDAARDAQARLNASCQSCHREHRGGRKAG